MRKPFCITILSIIAISASSQILNHKFKIVCTYRLSYQPDSTDIKSKKAEDMLLLIGDTSSIFESKNNYLQDSVVQIDPQDFSKLAYLQSVRTKFKFKIIKYPSRQLKYRDYIYTDVYEYEEPKDHFNWQISGDTATINGFLCQKATTFYSGRKWTAWFTTDIPINDGPYKFNGLPGLIIKINDEQNYFVFVFTGLSNRQGILPDYNKGVAKVTKEKFYASLTYFLDNQYEISILGGEKIRSGENAIKQRMEEDRKKNNNAIELIPTVRKS